VKKLERLEKAAFQNGRDANPDRLSKPVKVDFDLHTRRLKATDEIMRCSLRHASGCSGSGALINIFSNKTQLLNSR